MQTFVQIILYGTFFLALIGIAPMAWPVEIALAIIFYYSDN